ncbi:MAG: hypothetical protein ACRCX2_33325 [Paraclostridium sp.]
MTQVNLDAEIKVSPAKKMPYPSLRGVLGEPDSKSPYWQVITVGDAVGIITAGYPLDKVEEDGSKTPLTVEGLLTPPPVEPDPNPIVTRTATVEKKGKPVEKVTVEVTEEK